MCGIFASFVENEVKQLNEVNDANQVNKVGLDPTTVQRFEKIKHRGPDGSYTDIVSSKNISAFLGFHRLAIMGITTKENRILENNGVYMLCNGEIYRHRDFAKRFGLVLETDSDCEVILKLYTQYQQDPLNLIRNINYFKNAVKMLDGDFAFIIWDSVKEILIVARDRRGVRPLFYGMYSSGYIEFASEEKALRLEQNIKHFPPGHIYYRQQDFSNIQKYCEFPQPSRVEFSDAKDIINILLTKAVTKRLVSDRPKGFLLSGGLDSSLVASIAARYSSEPITTFSIGYPDSPDLMAARKVAEDIGSNHHEVILTDSDILQNIDNLIYSLGSYETTTARASMPMYILSKYISEKTDVKVLFSGEGADEIFAGYLYLHKAPGFKELQDELESLVSDLYLFDVLRADRTTAAWGLELRVPFLDADLVDFVMSLDPSVKIGKDRIEKLVLREAFKGYLPESVLYRRKEAFSDGVGSRSIELLKDMADRYVSLQSFKIFEEAGVLTGKAVPKTAEQKMYYSIFRQHFGNFNCTEKYWMPKWSPEVGDDPSATFLQNY